MRCDAMGCDEGLRPLVVRTCDRGAQGVVVGIESMIVERRKSSTIRVFVSRVSLLVMLGFDATESDVAISVRSAVCGGRTRSVAGKGSGRPRRPYYAAGRLSSRAVHTLKTR